MCKKLACFLKYSGFAQARLDRTETEILELSSNYVNLQANYLELTEMKQVLEKTQGFFTEVS